MNYFKKVGAVNRLYNYFDEITPNDATGRSNTSDSSLISILKSKGVVFKEEQQRLLEASLGSPLEANGFLPGGIPMFSVLNFTDPFSHPALSTGTKGVNIGAADPKHIRGNSSNYYTVHVGNINGINKLDIKESSSAQIENIKNIVSQELAANLMDVINDVQIVK